MWVGSSSTSFSLEAGSCETAQHWGKPVTADPAMIFLTWACSSGPRNHCTGVPCLAIPICKPILLNQRNWTLDPLLLHALSMNSRTHRLLDLLPSLQHHFQWKQWCFCRVTAASQGCSPASGIAYAEVTTQILTLKNVGPETDAHACRHR